MAQAMTGAAVGRVNRRFLFLALVLAVLAGVLAYAAFSQSKGGGETTAGGTSVVVARSAIPAGTQITADMLAIRDLPSAAVGDQPFTTIDDVVGLVARYPIPANDQILASKIVGGVEIASNDVLHNIIESGKRGMAINTEAVIGAGGLVLPGDHVDVYWIPNSPRDDVRGALLVAENVEVLAVEQILEDVPPSAPGAIAQNQDQNAEPSGERVPGSDAEPTPDAATVTLMLTPDQASRVFCADGNKDGSIRLAVRAFGDDSPSGLPISDCVILGQATTQ